MREAGLSPRLADAGLAILLLSPVAGWPTWGYDTLQRAVAVAGALAILAGGLHRRRTRASDARPTRSWTIAAAVFLGAHVLSAVAAVRPSATLLALVPVSAGMAAFWGIARGWISDTFLQRGLPLCAAGSAVALAAWGITQAALGTPAVSSLGNTNYSGAYAAILAVLCLVAALSPGSAPVRVSGAAGALAAVSLLAVSGSRGGLLGLAAGTLVASLALFRNRGRWVGGAALTLLLAAGAWRFDRVRALFDLSDSSVRTRLSLWKGSLRLAASHPIVGCGAGNFQEQYPPFRESEEFLIGNREHPESYTEAREPHSTPLLILAETGPAGFAAFLLLFVLAARSGLRALKAGGDSAVAIPLLAAYGVASLFNSLHAFSPFNAIVAVPLGMLARADARPEASPGRFEGMLRAGGLAALLALLAIALREIVVEDSYASARREPDPGRRIALLQRTLRWRSSTWPARYEQAVLHRAAGDPVGALREYRQVLEVHPHHVPSLNGLAICMIQTREPEAEARRHFDRALALQPAYWLTPFNVGMLHADRRRYDEARASFLKSMELYPGHAMTYYYLGLVDLFQGRGDGAVGRFRQAVERGLEVRRELERDRPDLRHDPRFAEFFK